MVLFFVILALVFVVLLVIITNIVIVPQSMTYVIERLGSYSDSWSAGLHVKIPFVERVAKKVSLKEQVADFPPQPVITRDNVTMQIDTVVFFQVMDAKLYTYGVNQPIAAIESLSATTLRNIIGEMELDHTLTSRDVINGKITAILDEATDKWGIKVNRVEVKNIIPPREIQEAMEKQMKAEREKRAVILKADGEKQAAITAAQPDEAVRKALEGRDFGSGRVVLVAAGKGAWQMANAASRILGSRIDTGIVITKYDHSKGPIANFTIREAGHPPGRLRKMLHKQNAQACKLLLRKLLRRAEQDLFLCPAQLFAHQHMGIAQPGGSQSAAEGGRRFCPAGQEKHRLSPGRQAFGHRVAGTAVG